MTATVSGVAWITVVAAPALGLVSLALAVRLASTAVPQREAVEPVGTPR